MTKELKDMMKVSDLVNASLAASIDEGKPRGWSTIKRKLSYAS